MRIKEILSQHRRDFIAIFECEHCQHEYERKGYDDAYFHNTVVPDIACPKCDKKSGSGYVPKSTQYPEGYQI